MLRQKGSTWRSARSEGGGVLYDYACHALDLVNFVLAPPTAVDGVVQRSIFSRDVDDEIYCSLHFADGATGQLAVNWSDESYRKMFTKVTVWGSNGRVSADRQECQIYLRSAHPALADTQAGWTVRYTTELTPTLLSDVKQVFDRNAYKVVIGICVDRSGAPASRTGGV